MAEQIRYEKPPLIEAVCEFRFVKIGVQAVLIPGRYYERVRTEYPEIEVKRGFGLQAGGPEVEMVTEERTVFRNPIANRLVQIGHGMLAINQLRPYIDYATFRHEVEARLNDYKAVAQPKGLAKLGLRYINRLPVSDDQNLSAVLDVGFKIPAAVSTNPDPYLLRLEFPYHKARERLILIVAKAAEHREKSSVMLDLDYVLTKPEEIQETDPVKWMDTAHDTIESVFHACVTKKAVASFKPIGPQRGRL